MTAYVRSPEHGPLPILLLLLVATTGLVDAVSVLALGKVFVANMTGNVVFLGFAIAGTPGFSLPASLAAVLGYLVGAFGGGVLGERRGGHRGRLLVLTTAVELGLLLVVLVLVLALGPDVSPGVAPLVAALLAVAMGLQNSTARRLAVPDLTTTTVLTTTLTGIAVDLRRGGAATLLRRTLAVLTLFAGAAFGALLVTQVAAAWALGVALLLVGAVAATAVRTSLAPRPWHAPTAR